MNLISTNQPLTMSSREIARVTNKEHFHVKRDIEKMFKELELDVSKFGCTYKDSQNRNQTEYKLNRNLTETLITGYSAKLRFMVIERLRELEAQQDTPEMQMAIGMMAAQKVIEQQAQQLEAMKPKADFYDAVTGSSDTVDIAEAAKVLNIKGVGRNKLFELLRNMSILDKRNQPYQTFVDRGYFRIIETSYQRRDGSQHINLKTVVYQKGLDYIRKRVATELGE